MVPRVGEFCFCCCVPLPPQLACSILETWEQPYGDSLYLSERRENMTQLQRAWNHEPVSAHNKFALTAFLLVAYALPLASIFFGEDENEEERE